MSLFSKGERYVKNSLFRRLFLVITAALLITALILTGVMVILVRGERQSALENELRLQARDFAQLMRQSDSIIIWRDASLISGNIRDKLSELRNDYGADVWLLRQNGMLMSFGENTASVSTLSDQEAVAQIYRVLEGSEITVRGLFSQLGDSVVTIGVPWTDWSGQVQGAVLLHVSVHQMSADYSDILRYSGIGSLVAMVFGVAVSYAIARRQSGPVKEIQQVVADFAGGNLASRARVHGHDDMAQLAQSINAMAEDLSKLEESRRSFVANVSHELRSPLTCIQGYCQGMLDGTILQSEHDKYLEIVLSESQRLTKLVNTLLDLSKYESGQRPLNKTAFDVNNLLLTVLFKFEQRIENKGIDVNIDFTDPQCFVRADADQITQVATNLVDNAVKFTPEGGKLTIHTHSAGKQAVVTVQDTGIGISAEDLPYIFDRFYKADKAHTSGMGTGLGLSIVKKILEQHGQDITCSSGPSGTSFTFTLEKAPSPEEARPAEPTQDRPPRE